MWANNVSPYPEGYYYTVNISANIEHQHVETHSVHLCWKMNLALSNLTIYNILWLASYYNGLWCRCAHLPKAQDTFLSQLQCCFECELVFLLCTIDCLSSVVIIRMRKLGDREKSSACSNNHPSPRGSLIKPWKQACSCCSSCLELVWWLIMWPFPPTATESGWSHFLHFSWLVPALSPFMEQNIIFDISFPPSRTHHAHLFNVSCIVGLLFLYSLVFFLLLYQSSTQYADLFSHCKIRAFSQARTMANTLTW